MPEEESQPDEVIEEEEHEVIVDQDEEEDEEEEVEVKEEDKREDLVKGDEEKEDQNKQKKRSKTIIIAQFFIPFIIALIVIGCLYLLLPQNTFYTLGFWMLVYFFPPFGKESVIPLAILANAEELKGKVPFQFPEVFVPIDPWLIASAIAAVDIIVGLFLIWNFDLIKKVPILGKWIKKTERKGGTVLEENKYIEALSFLGIVFFVMFPFQGSGGVGASIVGRVIGMNRYKVWVAIIIGAIVGCFLIAYAADTFFAVFMENTILGILILIIIIVLVAVLLIRRRKKRVQNKKSQEKDSEEE